MEMGEWCREGAEWCGGQHWEGELPEAEAVLRELGVEEIVMGWGTGGGGEWQPNSEG